MGFEHGASGFEARTTVPDQALAPLPALLRACGVARGGVWLDVGAGTGQLARALRNDADAYLALDRSPAMLGELQRRLGPGVHPLLADADHGWPLAAGSVSTVCLFRVAHLLDAAHLTRELRRACAGGAHVLWLRRRRDPGSARERLKAQMRARVAELRGDSRDSEGAGAPLRKALGSPVVEAHVSHWRSESRLANILQAWNDKDGLAGGPLVARAKASLIDELRGWASRELGDLYAPQPGNERLELRVFRFA